MFYWRCSYNKISTKIYREFSSSFFCSNIGIIYYRALETDKAKALQQSNGNHDTFN